MQNISHALSNLRQLTGIDTLDFDFAGNLTLLFNDYPINFSKLNEHTFEIWTSVDRLAKANELDALKRLLEANYLGGETGAGRFALSRDGDVTLCERIDVRPLDDQVLVEKISSFARSAVAWKSDDRAAPGRQQDEPIAIEDFPMIRV